MTLHIHKIVAALPSQLEPNALYAVRAGVGFDLYLADSTGSMAHPVNTMSMVVFTDRTAYDAYVPSDNQIAVFKNA